MNFLLTDIQSTLQDEARRFAKQRLLPVAREMEETAAVPADLWSQAGELGFFSLLIPEADGGVGLGATSFVLVTEALASASPGFALRYLSHVAGSTALLCMGSLQESYLTGERSCAYVLGGDIPDSDSLIVAELGDTGRVLQETLHLEAERRAVNALGHSAAALTRVLRLSSPVASCAPSGASLIFRLGLAGLALGSASAGYEAGRLYALERKQFGRAIASFQAIQWKVADSALLCDSARLCVRRAADRVSIALSTEAPSAGREADREVAQARLFAVKAAKVVTDYALQVHGGYGYTREYPVELHLRSAHMCGRGLKLERARLASAALG